MLRVSEDHGKILSLIGATAVVSWMGNAGSSVDLTLVGNHGALYHEMRDAFEDQAAPAEVADKDMLALIERALRSRRPEAAGDMP